MIPKFIGKLIKYESCKMENNSKKKTNEKKWFCALGTNIPFS